MANLQASLRSQSALAFDQPEALLRSVNRLFYDNTGDGAYASLFFADYDEVAGRLRYVNCGHLSGLLVKSDGKVDRLESTSTLLGLFQRLELLDAGAGAFARGTFLRCTLMGSPKPVTSEERNLASGPWLNRFSNIGTCRARLC
jgi:Stage II sporulation protein E (SpoIIE)